LHKYPSALIKDYAQAFPLKTTPTLQLPYPFPYRTPSILFPLTCRTPSFPCHGPLEMDSEDDLSCWEENPSLPSLDLYGSGSHWLDLNSQASFMEVHRAIF
jgi:hypothetical protein